MNNPPAFPQPFGRTLSAEDVLLGMTLRDYFAAKAMQAAIRNHSSSAEALGSNVESTIAELSFKMADAMLKAREQ